MNKTKLKAIFPSIVYLIIAGVFFIQTFQIRQSTSGDMGAITPRTIPRLIILLFAVCAVINMIQSWKKAEETEKLINRPLCYLIIGLDFLMIALLAKKIGFIIMGSIFQFVLFCVLEDEKLTKKRVGFYFLIAIALTFLFCYGFRYGLHVRIPLYPRR